MNNAKTKKILLITGIVIVVILLVITIILPAFERYLTIQWLTHY